MGSFGESLRRERELRGISLREIADATKISVRFLEALEHDRVELLPEGVFRRAFVKQYAVQLGLDADKLVSEFVHAFERAEPQEEKRAEVRGGTHPAGLLLSALVVLVALLSLLKARPGRQTREETPPIAPAPARSLPQDRVYPAPAPDGRLAGAENGGLVLMLSARQTCWVHVKVDGQTTLNRVLEEGQSETIEARGEIVLSVGNAGGLEFTVNDRRGAPLGRDGEVRRNIVITKQSLPSLLEIEPVRASRSG